MAIPSASNSSTGLSGMPPGRAWYIGTRTPHVDVGDCCSNAASHIAPSERLAVDSPENDLFSELARQVAHLPRGRGHAVATASAVERPDGLAPNVGRQMSVAHRHLDGGMAHQLLHGLERHARMTRCEANVWCITCQPIRRMLARLHVRHNGCLHSFLPTMRPSAAQNTNSPAGGGAT